MANRRMNSQCMSAISRLASPLRAFRPHADLPIMLGVGFMDILDGLLIVAGVDRVTPNLNSGPYLFFDLTFVDWDHSLLMAIVLSLIWAAVFWGDKRTTLIASVAVFSHLPRRLAGPQSRPRTYPTPKRILDTASGGGSERRLGCWKALSSCS